MQAKPSYFNSIKVSKLDTAHAIPQPQIESKITTACSSNDSDSELKLGRNRINVKVVAWNLKPGANLRRHKHRCDECGKIFNRIFNPRRHNKKNCEKLIDHMCVQCVESLRNYMIRHCPVLISSARITCKACGSNFTKTSNLRRHQSNACPALKD